MLKLHFQSKQQRTKCLGKIKHKQKYSRTLEYEASNGIMSKKYWKEEELALAKYAATWE